MYVAPAPSSTIPRRYEQDGPPHLEAKSQAFQVVPFFTPIREGGSIPWDNVNVSAGAQFRVEGGARAVGGHVVTLASQQIVSGPRGEREVGDGRGRKARAELRTPRTGRLEKDDEG